MFGFWSCYTNVMYLPSLKKVLYALAKVGKAVSQPLNNVATKVTSASSPWKSVNAPNL